MTTFKRGGLRFWRIGPVGGSFYGPGPDWEIVAIGFCWTFAILVGIMVAVL